MRNAEIAAALRELGILYELDGADRFRVQAYREAARTVAESPVSIEQLAEDGRLTELPAIGKTLAEKIETLIETGSIPSADKLKAKFPATLVEVTRVPGLGAKTARRIYDELGVENLTQLKEAAEQGRISGMRGLGPKAEENILSSLEGVTEDGIGERLLLSSVLPVAEEIRSDLLALGVANRIEIAGSARRWTETCKDLDLIATTDDAAGLVEALATHGLSAESQARRRCRRQRADPCRAQGRSSDRDGGDLRQPASALHRLRRAQRRAPRAGAPARLLGQRARSRRGRGEEGPPLSPRRRACTSCSASPTSSRSCARAGARSRRATPANCPTWSPSTTSAATSTATRPCRMGGTASRRWRRRRGAAATPTWRSPTTPRATASATTSPRSSSPSGSRRSVPGTSRRREASGCWPARR